MTPDELLDALRPHLDGLLLATDFDGTLAPLQKDPEASRPVAGTIEALTALAHAGARVAVVTGRDARTVLRLGGLDAVPRLVVAGIYGAETWADGTLTTPDEPDSVRQLRRRLPAALEGAADGVWVEDKRLSLVVHTRQTADPAGELERLREPVSAVAEDLGFEVHPGSGVLELRLPGFDKGGAIERLVAAAPTSAVLYLGDDLGDVPAFEEVRRLRADGLPAYGVAVLASAVPEVRDAADVTLDDPAAVVGFLSRLG